MQVAVHPFVIETDIRRLETTVVVVAQHGPCLHQVPPRLQAQCHRTRRVMEVVLQRGKQDQSRTKLVSVVAPVSFAQRALRTR